MRQAQSASSQIRNPRTFLSMNPDLNSLVEKMWETENFSPSMPTKEDEICEDIFRETFVRQPNGRYVVTLPSKENPSSLGDSYTLAKIRLISLKKKRLEKNSSSQKNQQ